MRFTRRHVLRFATFAAASFTMPRIALAQSYPSRSITVVVPFPAGGSPSGSASRW